MAARSRRAGARSRPARPGGDQTGERVWSTALPLGLSVIALAACLFATTLAPAVVLLSLTLIGTYAFKGPFWALSSEMMGPATAPAGLAAVNAIGNLAGFLGSSLIGVIVQATGSYLLALTPLLVLEAVGCAVLLTLVRQSSAGAAARVS